MTFLNIAPLGPTGGSMRKWRYKIRSFEIRDRWSPKKQTEEVANLEAELNGMGGEGWELIGVHAFKMVGSFGNDKGEAAVTLWKQPYDS